MTPAKFNRVVGTKIRRARRNCALKQVEFAALLGWANYKLSRIEGGHYPAKPAELLHIAEILALPVATLLPRGI